MKTLFVTGTDTSVGKTFVSAILIRTLRRAGLRAGAYKPVCSGAVLNRSGVPVWEDVEQLAAALTDDFSGNPANQPEEPAAALRQRICPQRFLAPLAPNVAARLEDRTVDDALLRTACRAWEGSADYLLIEGAGGFLSPVSAESDVGDLAADCASSVLIVAANRLGVINHTRLTVEAVQARHLSVAAVVLNDVRPPATSASETEEADVSANSNADELARLLPNILLLTCARDADRIVNHRQTELPSAEIPAALFGPAHFG
ncbi:MAG: dethiobiotin synthase [Planctomycetaceae bacterium]|nr:dethiobiotin synthase [Planctomycetaceae bacterium]